MRPFKSKALSLIQKKFKFFTCKQYFLGYQNLLNPDDLIQKISDYLKNI